MPPDDYPVYAPPLIVAVLSPSNTPAKVTRQRIVALSAGSEAFWVSDADGRTVQVTDRGKARMYSCGESIPLPMFGEAFLAVDEIFG